MSQTLLQKLLMRVSIQHLNKTILVMVLLGLCLVPTVNALGVGPLELPVSVEKGAETSFTRNIKVWNSLNKPIYVKASVSGPISEFITLEPEEFDLPAGPGMMSEEPSPSVYVKVIFNIPREIPESEYKGTVIFTEAPTTGGNLATAVALDVGIVLTIGEMAKAQFPVYVTGLIVVLVVCLILSLVVSVMRRYHE